MPSQATGRFLFHEETAWGWYEMHLRQPISGVPEILLGRRPVKGWNKYEWGLHLNMGTRVHPLLAAAMIPVAVQEGFSN